MGGSSEEEPQQQQRMKSHSKQQRLREEEQGERGEAEAQQQAEVGGEGPVEACATDGAAAEAAPVRDTWAQHVNRELSDAEVAALRAGHAKFTDPAAGTPSGVGGSCGGSGSGSGSGGGGGSGSRLCGERGDAAAYAAAWPRAKWQVAGRAALPPAPAVLVAAGVKERLRARWAEVHEVRGRGRLTKGSGAVAERRPRAPG
jgi:hypothetical protein